MKKQGNWPTVLVVLLVLLCIGYFFRGSLKKENQNAQKSRDLVSSKDIVYAGQKKDGIPAITKPLFISVSGGTWLKDDSVGISVEGRGGVRFYPLEILRWHEVVNDFSGDRAIAVTYSPLSHSPSVFYRTIQKKDVEFGVTGRVWNSQSVYYDRLTDSSWSPIWGRAIAGKLSGKSLAPVSYDTTTFGLWKRQFPKGEVLSRSTGFMRAYNKNPYQEYEDSDKTVAPYKPKDSRLPAKTIVVGISLGGRQKAYPRELILKKGIIEDTIGKTNIKIEVYKPLGSIRGYVVERTKETRIPLYEGYWFTWAAVYSKTQLDK